jgi:F420-0:gamma-glutamyl ligase
MADEETTGADPEGGQDQPSEEELRAQLEEEIRKVKVQDVILQSAVSILNLAARRIAKEDERDLAQAKAGIDAADALVEFVPEEAQGQLRQALSELQLLYAKHAGEDPDEGDEGG